jgi:hypothetical protein
MTRPPEGLGQQSEASIEAAIGDSAQLRQQLLRASRGDVAAAEVGDSLRGYWSSHRSVLTAAVAAVGEQVRLHVLQQLYDWRAQLTRQLQPQPTAESSQHGGPGTGSTGKGSTGT